MAPFKKDFHLNGGSRRPFDNRGGGSRFGGSREGGRGNFGGDKELFSAECNSCHKNCQVPFRPNGKKPVYCSDCFKQEEPREQRPRFERNDSRPPQRSFGPPSAPAPDSRIDGLKRQLDAMQSTLDRIVSIVENSSRAAALTKEMRKYVPADKPAHAPTRKVIAKAPAKKEVKKDTKKPAAKKIAKATKKA